MTELEALRERHSVRKYTDRELAPETEKKLRDRIDTLNKDGGLRMQLVTNERKAFKGGLFTYGKFTGVANYVLIIGTRSESLDYRAGYYGEKLVVYAQQLGLRTCWVGLTYKKIPGTFTLRDEERVVCCIAIGYGADDGVRHKMKRADQISNISTETPRWFEAGVQAALLSPTAVNQMKFRFDYLLPLEHGGKGRVKPEKGFSLVGYTKIDLGIGMCDFEIGAGKENFEWYESPLK